MDLGFGGGQQLPIPLLHVDFLIKVIYFNRTFRNMLIAPSNMAPFYIEFKMWHDESQYGFESM